MLRLHVKHGSICSAYYMIGSKPHILHNSTRMKRVDGHINYNNIYKCTTICGKQGFEGNCNVEWAEISFGCKYHK